MTSQARFERCISPEPMSGCWLWTGSVVGRGYGVFWDGERNVRATHYALKVYRELEVLKGMQACHTCDVPPCVNPDHLFIGTPSDNMQDCLSKGRHYLQLRDSCKRGHPYTEGNTLLRHGTRECRTCRWDMRLKLTARRRALGIKPKAARTGEVVCPRCLQVLAHELSYRRHSYRCSSQGGSHD